MFADDLFDGREFPSGAQRRFQPRRLAQRRRAPTPGRRRRRGRLQLHPVLDCREACAVVYFSPLRAAAAPRVWVCLRIPTWPIVLQLGVQGLKPPGSSHVLPPSAVQFRGAAFCSHGPQQQRFQREYPSVQPAKRFGSIHRDAGEGMKACGRVRGRAVRLRHRQARIDAEITLWVLRWIRHEHQMRVPAGADPQILQGEIRIDIAIDHGQRGPATAAAGARISHPRSRAPAVARRCTRSSRHSANRPPDTRGFAHPARQD